MKKMINAGIICLLSSLVFSCQKEGDKSFGLLPPKENPKGYILEAKNIPESDWFVKDPSLDGLEGVSSERAQVELQLTNARQIIVAVIDGGVDTDHEDLKNKIWKNLGETGVDEKGHDKSNNGIDDDNNGYVDDIHGWNFLGSKNGEHVEQETLEVTRESLRYDKKIANGDVLTEAEKKYFEEINKDYNQQVKESKDLIEQFAPLIKKAEAGKKVLKDKLQLEDLSLENLKAISSTDAEVLLAKSDLIDICEKYRSIEALFRYNEYAVDSLKFNLNKEFNPRAVVGDNPDDFSDIHYGNNDVKGPDSSHGSHVAGIIGAERKNGLGIDGVAENVKIMALRAVPNGDERDKDIALAVRYAVDNGAHIINMSFGKKYSPAKSKVDEAFIYAAQKGVLLFHAAGNDAKNNDDFPSYPNRYVQDAVLKKLPTEISTWIEVGASAKNKNLRMAAAFSNFGKKTVDLFAPGVQLKSTFPDNEYAVISGTSMACPAAAGVGALLMSNFENMTAVQAKAILIRQVRLYEGLEVHLPGSADLDLPVPFASLSSTGGLIDAYSSIQLARKLSQKTLISN